MMNARTLAGFVGALCAAACASDAGKRQDDRGERVEARRPVSLEAARPLFKAHLQGKVEAEPIPEEHRAAVQVARTNGRYLADHDRVIQKAARRLGGTLSRLSAELQGAMAWQEDAVWKVHFVADRGDFVSIEAWVAADGTVAARSEQPASLDRHARERWLARQAAMDTYPQTREARWQAVVVGPVPVDGTPRWVVTLLRRTPGDGAIPIGGHRTLWLDVDTLAVARDVPHANSEQRFGRGAEQKGRKRALTISHVRSATPIDSHVFTSLHYGVTIYVATSAGAWVVDGHRVGYLGMPEPR